MQIGYLCKTDPFLKNAFKTRGWYENIKNSKETADFATRDTQKISKYVNFRKKGEIYWALAIFWSPKKSKIRRKNADLAHKYQSDG